MHLLPLCPPCHARVTRSYGDLGRPSFHASFPGACMGNPVECADRAVSDKGIRVGTSKKMISKKCVEMISACQLLPPPALAHSAASSHETTAALLHCCIAAISKLPLHPG